ncbi:MAG: hypothetical protein ACI9LY_000126 [Arenicella sp.]|jgi:hypothetical protein
MYKVVDLLIQHLPVNATWILITQQSEASYSAATNANASSNLSVPMLAICASERSVGCCSGANLSLLIESLIKIFSIRGVTFQVPELVPELMPELVPELVLFG